MDKSSINAATQTSEFFQQWQIYRDVINQNYMYHNELGGILNQYLQTYDIEFDVLDLGCGDAELFARSPNTSLIKHYTGVDMSSNALSLAEERLQSKSFVKDFIIDDFCQYLSHNDKEYDLIVVGYTLHHLTTAHKIAFFETAKTLLKPAGRLLIYDVVRRDDETRDEFVDRLCKSFAEAWNKFDQTQLASIYNHVRNNDQPENELFFKHQAERLGYHYSMDYRDKDEFYSLMSFQR
jgi:SAM-dependent methyltransferase